jgi:hypothetical protein
MDYDVVVMGMWAMCGMRGRGGIVGRCGVKKKREANGKSATVQGK